MNSKDIQYIEYEEAINVYNRMIDNSGGGFEGIRDEGGIRAALDFVQDDTYYPDFTDKLTYLVFRFCSGHFLTTEINGLHSRWELTFYIKME